MLAATLSLECVACAVCVVIAGGSTGARACTGIHPVPVETVRLSCAAAMVAAMAHVKELQLEGDFNNSSLV